MKEPGQSSVSIETSGGPDQSRSLQPAAQLSPST